MASLRLGSSIVYQGLLPQDVHSLHTVELADGVTYRVLGAGNRVFSNGVDQGVNFDGSGDIAFGDDSYQIFMARGSTKKKTDGSGFFNWGIAPPVSAPTLQAVNNLSSTIASFNAGESPALVIHEGTSSGNVSGWDGTSNGALSIITAQSSGRLSVSKTYATLTDLLNIGGSEGSDTDLFDIYLWIEEPRELDKLTIMFGLGTEADPFVNDHYYFDIDPKSTVNIKDASALVNQLATDALKQSLSAVTPQEFITTRTPEQALEIMRRLGRFAGPRARERTDAAQNSPAWFRITVARGQFNRVGGTPGRDWRTVKAFKLTFVGLPGVQRQVFLDSAVFIGGGDASLTGRYRVGYRYVRNNGAYREKSPLSPLSDTITLNQQALQITISSVAIAGADPQVNELEIYMVGGFIPTLHRCAVTSATPSSSTMAIDEFDRSSDGTIDAADRTRLVNQGLTIPGFTPDQGIVLTLRKSDAQILADNEQLEPFCVLPPDNIVAIAGPYANRMFALTSEGWLYVSSHRSPSNFSVSWVLDLRRYGDPLWMVRMNGGIHVGMEKDVVLAAGTGDESEDHLSIDLFPQPLHVANPPVDSAVYTDGNVMVYRAADGLMTLSGVSLAPVNQSLTSLLWRGHTRHGVLPLNIVSGRFRLAVDNQVLFMVAPEGSATPGSNTLWRYYFEQQKWARTTYPWSFLSIFRDPDGSLIAGTTDGKLVLLDTGTQDAGQNITVEVLYPLQEGRNPLTRKKPFDLQFHGSTGGTIGVITVTLDGAETSYDFATVGSEVYRINISALPTFLRAKLKITGNFSGFKLQAANLTYRDLPQQMMVLDTGYILPQEPGDLVWMNEAEVDCISPVDLQLLVYLDDVLHGSPLSVQVKPNVRSSYRVVLPKGSKARRPRMEIRTTNANGMGSIGFECYTVRIRERSSGNTTEKQMRTVYPAGQAE